MRLSADQFKLFDLEPEQEAVTLVTPPNGNGHTSAKRKKEAEPPPEPAITGTPEGQTVTEFITEHGRMPFLQDERKPWTFRGWLMWYRQELERTGQFPPVWDYWFATHLAGKLLPEQPPRIEYVDDARGPGYRHLEKLIDIVRRHDGGWSPMAPLMDWLSWGLATSKEPPKISEELNEALYREIQLHVWLQHPSDYLGTWLAEHQHNRWGGFFPTPHSLCEIMTLTLLKHEGEDLRAKTVCDPAVGTGRMLLHAGNYSLRLHGQDVNAMVLQALKINGALYCPWLIRPFPEEIFKGEGFNYTALFKFMNLMREIGKETPEDGDRT
ncbi:MAG TPA: hypothetical protein VFY05_04695 [Candidatus Angelobacter sp.]|nr:hypothetical protein [Candidatus Angelobacter sp.]